MAGAPRSTKSSKAKAKGGPKPKKAGHAPGPKWTEGQIRQLVQLRDELGLSWQQLAEKFHGRTKEAVRAKYRLAKEEQEDLAPPPSAETSESEPEADLSDDIGLDESDEDSDDDGTLDLSHPRFAGKRPPSGHPQYSGKYVPGQHVQHMHSGPGQHVQYGGKKLPEPRHQHGGKKLPGSNPHNPHGGKTLPGVTAHKQHGGKTYPKKQPPARPTRKLPSRAATKAFKRVLDGHSDSEDDDDIEDVIVVQHGNSDSSDGRNNIVRSSPSENRKRHRSSSVSSTSSMHSDVSSSTSSSGSDDDSDDPDFEVDSHKTFKNGVGSKRRRLNQVLDQSASSALNVAAGMAAINKGKGKVTEALVSETLELSDADAEGDTDYEYDDTAPADPVDIPKKVAEQTISTMSTGRYQCGYFCGERFDDLLALDKHVTTCKYAARLGPGASLNDLLYWKPGMSKQAVERMAKGGKED